jgi:two-component system alkaline phosphatase synthesis response regulator PhoP
MSGPNATILIVDDEPDILEFLEYNLQKEGYTVVVAENGLQAIQQAKENLPDLILLDIMMPEMDGIETCRELRSMPEFKQTLIAFLTARGEDFTQIAGFDVGADDYITKPIKPRLLVSRINALLRRQTKDEVETALQVGSIRIDREKFMVIKDQQELFLPRKEFELLYLLASKPGKVFKREEILNRIWGKDVIVGDRTIDVHIRKLREKLGDDAIKTIKGIGYKLDL